MGRPNLEIEYRNPAHLQPSQNNSRTHSPEQVRQIRAAMDEFGFTNPILLKDDETTIGAGHGRQEAALLDPPLEQVPTITLRGLTEEQWRAYIIADNKLALGAGWNEDLLRAELLDLQNLGFDTALTGFSADELELLLVMAPPPGDPEFVPDTPTQPVSALGDIWLLGRHRLICGDATDPAVVSACLGEHGADLCLSDPPYGIGYSYRAHDDRDNDANAQLVAKAFALAPKAKIWTPGLMNLGRDIRRFGEAKVLVWHKGFAAAGNGMGGASTWEPILVVAPKRKKLANDYLAFKTDREELDGKSLREHHPCPKPVALFAHLLKAFSGPNDRIYEPFAGAATTLIACQLAQRTCCAVEIDPAYIDVGVLRWEALTGEKATLEGSGMTMEAARAERHGGEAIG